MACVAMAARLLITFTFRLLSCVRRICPHSHARYMQNSPFSMPSCQPEDFTRRWSAIGCSGTSLSRSRPYPAKPIRLIVPFAAGSANDVVARFVAAPLSDALGRQVVIDNRAGAAGNLGAEIAAKSPPDGYTLMIGNIAHAISMTLYDKPGYDLAKDFAPISMLAAGSFMLALHPSVPAKTVKELIAFARPRPGQLNIGVSG